MRTREHDCCEPEYPCGICGRLIDQLESEREFPTRDDGSADLEADRFERWLQRIGEAS